MEDVKPVEASQGAFYESLIRSNSKIKQDRAKTILLTAEQDFRRRIEDIGTEYQQLIIKRDNLLDMSPDSAVSLQLAKNFDSQSFVKTEEEIAVAMRHLEIKIQQMHNRYQYLFGKTLNLTQYGI